MKENITIMGYTFEVENVPYEAVKPVKEKPVIDLECSCCGRGTRGRQWWNQDTGYGLCNRCVKIVVGEETDTNTHGKKGVHFSVEV